MVDDDDVLEVDSPEVGDGAPPSRATGLTPSPVLQQPPVDGIEDEDEEELVLPPSAATPVSIPTTPRLAPPKEKPRAEQLEYQKSLPYAVESLEEMDGKLELIVRRLVECIQAKD